MTLQQQKKTVEKVGFLGAACGGGGGSIGGPGTDCELARSARFRDLISLGFVTASELLRDVCAVSLMTITV